MKLYATHIVTGLAVLGLIFIFVGCDKDETGPTRPTVSYLPQTFSLAICDGATDSAGKADNHGYSHNGNPTIKLDWDATSGSSSSLPVTYIYNSYPLIDGGAYTGPDGGDADVWANAEWTTIALTPQYGDGGVTSVKMKAVYTYVNPPRIWFLLNWSDPVDYPDAEVPYNSGMYGNCWYNTGLDDDYGGFRHDHRDDQYNGISWAHNEDWVSFMFNTWHKDYPDGYHGDNSHRAKWDQGPNHDQPNEHALYYGEPIDPTSYAFVEQAQGYQTNGCNITCHETDPTNPHKMVNNGYNYNHEPPEDGPTKDNWETYYPYNDEPDYGYTDMWFWSGTRTNYTSTGADWLSGTNDPAYLFDCYLDSTGMDWGPIDQKVEYDPPNGGDILMWYQVDEGLAGTESSANWQYGTELNPAYMSEDDPGANQAYFWKAESDLFQFRTTFAFDEWEAEDKIGGYLHKSPLGSAADVGSRGSYDMTTGEWTLEIGRSIGTYDKIDKTQDCLIGTFEAHSGQ
ncbi:MAG: hypothetical protein GY771_11445 [bacterium]|nr:hypothetical protein [bacterium]